MDRDPAVVKGVKGIFGETSYTSRGLLDRKLVAEKAFALPALRKRLNELVHPAVFREIERLVSQLAPDQRSPYVIIEAALIYESKLDKQLDYVVVVQAEEETRIRRVMDRDRSSREEVIRRMAAQLPPETTARKADFLLRNDGEIGSLHPQVQFLDRLLTLMRTTPGPTVR
jgi:dephospho-CoA kinase